ncbi:hypothetical protein PV433_24415 [Paenibacillus sp. GYB004]|uniref:hypothetical protein n=1 Tax=Paenibacillus sp. GYB004 TaxID=2994393 RepID=UPI002F96AFE5
MYYYDPRWGRWMYSHTAPRPFLPDYAANVHPGLPASPLSGFASAVGKEAPAVATSGSDQGTDGDQRAVRAGKAGDIVVICINGRSGMNSPGISKLRDTLYIRLSPLGVPARNVFRRSWNQNEDGNPLGTPWIWDLNNEIEERSRKPSYLAIIGHSYGGWAACRLSRVTAKIPNYIGLIDPVFGPGNTMNAADIPKAHMIKNWYQHNGVTSGNPCTGFGMIPCFPVENGLSCGYQEVPGAQNMLVRYMRSWDGTPTTVECPGIGEVPVPATHGNIDDDLWIQRQITEHIVQDVKKLLYSRSKR